MTDIEKALAMIAPSAFYEINLENVSILTNAFKAAIEQHEAFRQEVSDAVEMALKNYPPNFLREHFHQFIIPKPKPDPLVEAMNDIGIGAYENIKTEYADTLRADIVRRFRAALDALGFEIREKNDD